MPAFDVDALRAEFPALAREQDGRPVAFLDGPGGTQVPQRVIDAVVGYYRDMNANHEGAFTTSRPPTRWSTRPTPRSPTSWARARPTRSSSARTCRRSRSRSGVASGRRSGRATRSSSRPSTTRRTCPRGRRWPPIAASRSSTVDIRPDDVTLDLEDLESKLGPRTQLVAIGYASNAVGTINPVKAIVERAHEVGAMTYVDAVAYAPHGPIDVQALDTDFLVTSVYKWFGPHLGALYGKAAVLDGLPAFKVRPADDRFETGTQCSRRSPGRWRRPTTCATSAGPTATCRGARAPPARASDGASSWPGMVAIADYERALVTRLIEGLGDDPGRDHPRDHGPGAVRGRTRPDGLDLDRRRPPARRRRGARPPGHLRLGRRLLCDRPHRGARQGRDRRDPADRARPLQHGRRGRPDARALEGIVRRG